MSKQILQVLALWTIVGWSAKVEQLHRLFSSVEVLQAGIEDQCLTSGGIDEVHEIDSSIFQVAVLCSLRNAEGVELK